MMITARYAHTWKSALATAALTFGTTALAVFPIGIALVVAGALAGGWGLDTSTLTVVVLLLPFSWISLARTLVKAGEIHVTMDDHGYTREQVGKATGTVTWAGTKSIFRTCGFVMVRMPGGGIAATPESAYTPAQLAEIDAFIQTRTTTQQA